MDLKQTNETLNLYIKPQTFPLALKLCQSESELSERVRIPMRDLGYQITLCQGYGITRRFRWAVAVGKGDQCCVGGASAMGFIAERPNEELMPTAKGWATRLTRGAPLAIYSLRGQLYYVN